MIYSIAPLRVRLYHGGQTWQNNDIDWIHNGTPLDIKAVLDGLNYICIAIHLLHDLEFINKNNNFSPSCDDVSIDVGVFRRDVNDMEYGTKTITYFNGSAWLVLFGTDLLINDPMGRNFTQNGENQGNGWVPWSFIQNMQQLNNFECSSVFVLFHCHI